ARCTPPYAACKDGHSTKRGQAERATPLGPAPPSERRHDVSIARRTDNLTAEQRALRDAYLAETWAPCPEIPRDIRAGWAAVAGIRNELLDESTECGQAVDAA